MSIMVAAGIGLKAGLEVRDYVFNYSKDQYLAKISEIEDLRNKLSDHKTTLIELREQIPQFWSDDNAVETRRALEVTIDKVNNHMNTAEMVLKTLNEAVAEFDKSNEGVKGLINDAISLLNAVTDK